MEAYGSDVGMNATPTVTLDELDKAATPVRPSYPRNREIMLRFMERQPVEEIAAEYAIAPSTVLGIVRSPVVQQEMEQLYERADKSIKDRIALLGSEAVDTVRDTMRGRVASDLQFKAAKELLDKNPAFERKSGVEDAAQGLGESIIRELARRAAERTAVPPVEVTEAQVVNG